MTGWQIVASSRYYSIVAAIAFLQDVFGWLADGLDSTASWIVLAGIAVLGAPVAVLVFLRADGGTPRPEI